MPGSPVPSEGTREPFLIGVCGGTASGKTTVCDRIMHQLQERRVVLISQARDVVQAPGLAGWRGAVSELTVSTGHER